VLFDIDLHVFTGAQTFQKVAVTSKFLAPERPHEQVLFRESTDIRHCRRVMFARDTCSQDFVRYTSVLQHASWMLLDFSVVTGRSRKFFLMLVRGFARLPRHDIWIYYC
jgi:hypothetical protein